MKKICLLKFVFVFVGFVPAFLQAQDGEREIYLRPSYWRPYDKRGINVFETTKQQDSIPYDGPRIRFGAAFTQRFQNLKHENPTALYNTGSTFDNADRNKLYPIIPGFMTAMANLYANIQLADGVRLNLTTYLSTRHHNDTWVKGGYIQFDKLPFKGAFWDRLMEVATIKLGHMEINYGDLHFRRSDGGEALYNPFMESYIMDAFTTEIAGEVYLRKNGFMAMIGVSNGMIRGSVDTPWTSAQVPKTHVRPSVYVKLAMDKQVDQTRLRLSGSFYHNSDSYSRGLTLYNGDRAGSHYQNVMERWKPGWGPPLSEEIAFSGRFNPMFDTKVDAVMFNGFVKSGGMEFLGTYERAEGRSWFETKNRKASQYGMEAIYRFGVNENIFTGARFNGVRARIDQVSDIVNMNRLSIAGGWFLTRNLLLKGEYVIQKYNDFPVMDARSGGKFNGYVLEAVVGF